MIHIGLFEGIGGFSLAAEWAGWKTYATCEINEFGQIVLKHYWPDAYHHGDIHTLTYETINDELSRIYGSDWRNNDIIITGGFPCQPYSAAGKRLGKEDDRHLWPQMLRVIQEVQPTWVVGENVSGLINWSGGLVFDEVQSDLENSGYEVIPFILPAASVNAPHRRERVWFVAYSASKQRKRLGFEQREISEEKQGEFRGNSGEMDNRRATPNTDSAGLQAQRAEQQATGITGGSAQRATSDTSDQGLQRRAFSGSTGCIRKESNKQPPGFFCTAWDEFPTQSPICNGNDGFSPELDGITFSKWRQESVKAGGNAIVPQVAYQIFKAINDYKHVL